MLTEMKLDPEVMSKPTDAAISFFDRGGECLDQGNLDGAVQSYRAALDLEPQLVEAHFNLGLAYQGSGRFDLAVDCYRKALEIQPDYFSALNNLGQVLSLTGNRSAAEAAYCRAIAVNPKLAEPHFNLGELAVMRKDLDSAVTHYRRAIEINPEMVEAYNNLGNVFQKQGNFDAAARCYRKVVKLKPELAEGYYNLGSTLKDLDDAREAIKNLKHALRLKPGYKQALNNLALVYKNTGKLDQATRYFSEALALDPHFAEAHWNRSFTCLLKGDFANGWRDFEWRFKQPKWKTLYPFRLKGTRWDGSFRPDQRILVHDEQGLGDTFQFVRYIPMVKQRVGTVIFETRKSLMPVLEGFAGIDEMIERSSDGNPSARFDAYVPLMSLPYIFQTTPSTVPDIVPYLSAAPVKAVAWKKFIGESGFKVGIVWAGRPEHMDDRNRSCRLADFACLSKLPHIRWFGLQKGPAASQTGEWPASERFINLGEAFDDFTDTAGAIANLDLIISVDTSVAHLAGAMGKPVWVLLPFIPDWRWMMEREDTPWYPTMRLFRQPAQGNWNSVFNAVAHSLKNATQKAVSAPE